MKKYILILTILAAVTWAPSCRNDSGMGGRTDEGSLRFSSFVQDFDRGATRGIGNNFFVEGDTIEVNIQTANGRNVDNPFEYYYDDAGYFRGRPGFRFTLDDDYITTLTAQWPAQEIVDRGINLDQRELLNFKYADWMTATARAQNIMPTEAPVPLYFERQNSLLEFEVVGQNTEGLDIDTLLIELNIGGVDRACWAYCGDENGHAYLILRAGTKLESPEGYLIGTLTVNREYKYYIIFPYTELTLAPGTRYLVTLTPNGYDMTMYAEIGGWTQWEGGIGIPFTPPDPIDSDTFSISNTAQLVAMSYLIRHYYNPATFPWTSATYIIEPGIEIDPELAMEYIPVPQSVLTGAQILYNDEPVTELPYGDGQTLVLIDTQN